MNIVMDFEADWRALAAAELAARGYRVDPNTPTWDVTFKFVNVMRRTIEPRPRRVHVPAAGLAAAPEHEAGLQRLLEMIRRGDDVTAHLSTFMVDADFHDALLNDWGVHHFHLGTAPHPTKPGFAARTGPLLFARVTETDAYGLGIFEHSSFGDREVLETLHREWPDLIRKFQVNAISIRPEFTNAEIKVLRKKGVTFMVKTRDGTIYAPPGGGYMTSGHSASAVRHCDVIMERLRQATAQVDNVAPKVAAALKTSRGADGQDVRYRLTIQRDELYARAEGAPTIALGPLGF